MVGPSCPDYECLVHEEFCIPYHTKRLKSGADTRCFSLEHLWHAEIFALSHATSIELFLPLQMHFLPYSVH
jgi:hypothetical protein